MDNLTSKITTSLINTYGFVVERYGVNLDGSPKIMVIKYLPEGLYSIIFSTPNDEASNINLAKEYLSHKSSNYSINNLIFIENNPPLNQEYSYNCMVVDTVSKNIIFNNTTSNALLSVVEKALANTSIKQSVDYSHLIDKFKAFPVTFTIIAINILSFIYSAYLSNSISDININVLVYLGANYKPLIISGEYYRLITSMFLHGGLLHIAFNMYALYSLGALIEKVFGSKKFILIYFVSGLMGSLGSCLFSNSVSVGASGAIFGLLGSALVFGLKLRSYLNRDFIINIIVVIAMNVFLGLSSTGIDNFAHLGGLLGGVTMTILLFNKEKILKNI